MTQTHISSAARPAPAAGGHAAWPGWAALAVLLTGTFMFTLDAMCRS
jgi:hypothetical protein